MIPAFPTWHPAAVRSSRPTRHSTICGIMDELIGVEKASGPDASVADRGEHTGGLGLSQRFSWWFLSGIVVVVVGVRVVGAGGVDDGAGQTVGPGGVSVAGEFGVADADHGVLDGQGHRRQRRPASTALALSLLTTCPHASHLMTDLARKKEHDRGKKNSPDNPNIS